MKNNTNKANVNELYPVVRFRDMLSKKIYPRLDKESREYINGNLVSLLQRDPSGLNREGVVNFDALMLHVLNGIKFTKKKNLKFFQMVFSTFDISGKNEISFRNFLDIYQIVEVEGGILLKHDLELLKIEFCNFVGEVYNKKKTPKKKLKIEQFMNMCLTLGIFTKSKLLGKPAKVNV